MRNRKSKENNVGPTKTNPTATPKPNLIPGGLKKLKRINIFLISLIIIGLVYILAAPYLPHLNYLYKTKTDKSQGFVYDSEFARKKLQQDNVDLSILKPKPTENTLVIPSIGVDARIYEGESTRALDRGIWRRPKSSTPDKGGNTVLTAHRFMYTQGPNTFYSLDKVKPGDTFIVFWNNEEYTYQVEEIKIVEPSEISVEDNTETSRLTVYTCTPLGTSEQRLVIISKKLETL